MKCECGHRFVEHRVNSMKMNCIMCDECRGFVGIKEGGRV